MMFVSLDEVTRRTPSLESYGEGNFTVSPAQQRVMLTAYLNSMLFAIFTGTVEYGPEVSVTYHKVTDAPKRFPGQHYRSTPALVCFGHAGKVVKVARNRAGAPYFVILDSNRARPDKVGYTAMRLEGLETFSFREPRQMDAALAYARAVAR